MKQILSLTLLVILTFSCTHHKTESELENDNSITFSKSNELQFTFLVFDKTKVATFFERYSQFNSNNKHFAEDISQLKKTIYSNDMYGRMKSFKQHSVLPNMEDFEIALDNLNRKYYESDDEYFECCIQYVFFNQCLPEEIHDKWTQTIEGDFKFNYTFMFLLREKCKVIDQMIYGEIGYWDKKLEPILYEHIYNEITPKRAKKIKELLLKDPVFNDIHIRTDRDNFIYLLDETINENWRLLLTDWN